MEELQKEKGVVDMLNKELQTLLDAAREEAKQWKEKEQKFNEMGIIDPFAYDSPKGNKSKLNTKNNSPSHFLEVSAAEKIETSE